MRGAASTSTKVGDTITYVLKNTGNLTINSVTVTDDKLGVISTCPTTLAAGASATCTATYVVKQADVDAGKIVNKVVVNGTTSPGAVTEPEETTPQRGGRSGPPGVSQKHGFVRFPHSK